MTRVLVVEDEESFSEALSFMLRKEGYEVEVAADGAAEAAGGQQGLACRQRLLAQQLAGCPRVAECQAA